MTSPPPLVLSIFPSFAFGGAQVRYAIVANRLGAQFRHAVIAMDGNLDCAARLDPTLEVIYPQVAVAKGAMLANRARFRDLLGQLRPDVLVTHNWGSIEWAMANLPQRLRHVHIEDGFGPEERDRQIPRRVWARRLLLRSCRVVLPSRTLMRIARETWRLPERCLLYVPNGIDLARFAAPQRTGADGPVFGTVAALRPEKNLGRLLQAFAMLPPGLDARLVVIGDGPERPGLEAMAETLGIAARVRFAGHVGDPAAAYAGFDAFALSSDTEQMPISVLEAMAAGLPVAATDVGDVRDMLAPQNAPYVVAKEAGALGQAMAALAEAGPAARNAIGAANLAKAARDYDLDRMVLTYAALFRGEAPPA